MSDSAWDIVKVVPSGLLGIVCHTDDTLIYGKDQNEHDTRLRAALEAINYKNAGLTLNHNKCIFNQYYVLFPF